MNANGARVRKYHDDDMIEFMRLYLERNDHLPSIPEIASHFRVATAGVHQRLTRLERQGVFDRSEAGRIRFKRGS